MLKYGLSELDYFKLNKQSKKLDFGGCGKKIRVALLSDSAPQYLTPILKTLLYRNGIQAEVYEAEFDTIELEILNADSGLYQFNPDFIITVNSVFALRSKYYSFQGDKALFANEHAEKFNSLWESIQSKTKAFILQTNFVLPYERPFGNYDFKTGRSFYHAVMMLNLKMAERASSFRQVFITDQDLVAAYYGRKNWLDEKMWGICKSYCAFEYLPFAIQNIVDTVCSLIGAGIKCVVLDLDNTLWGGEIGDAGIEGIRLGHFEEGEAYQVFQHFLLELKKRGILLAVTSKNDPENALLPFQKHPEMVLKEDDITVFIANWVSKAENIKAVREILNIGYDSMIFLDDSPFERKLVRELLPDVIVPELPDDPALYVKTLSELNLFETTTFSEIDACRSDMYRESAQRQLAQKNFANPEDYLKFLEMKITLKRFDAFHLPRIAQLLQRSNQFNLLTRRFTEANCEEFLGDEKNFYPLYCKLKDKYGDNGLISVAILQFDNSTTRVEEWVMSCRVLGRGVEQAMMNKVFDLAKQKGTRAVVGRYSPTAKNAMVRNFYAQFGFEKIFEDENGSTVWELEVHSYKPRAVFIEEDKSEEEAVNGNYQN